MLIIELLTNLYKRLFTEKEISGFELIIRFIIALTFWLIICILAMGGASYD